MASSVGVLSGLICLLAVFSTLLLVQGQQAKCPARFNHVGPQNKKYYIHRAGLNWHRAQSNCKALGGQLASVSTPEDEVVLSKLFNHGVLWTGVRYVGGTYRNVQDLKHIVDNKFFVPLGRIDREGFCAGNHGAEMGLRTHTCAAAFFSFCECTDDMTPEAPITEGCTSAFVEASTNSDMKYFFFNGALKWKVAKQLCERIGGELATPRTHSELSQLANIHRHGYVWSGGEFLGGKYIWLNNENDTVADELVEGKKNREGFCLAVFAPHSTLRSANCLSARKVFCQCRQSDTAATTRQQLRERNTNLAQLTKKCPKAFNIVGHQNKRYYVHKRGLNWGQAHHNCRKLGGFLARVITSEDLGVLTKVWPGGLIWLGGRYHNSTTRWTKNNTVVQDKFFIPNARKDLAGHCTAIYGGEMGLRSIACGHRPWSLCECDQDQLAEEEEEAPNSSSSSTCPSHFVYNGPGGRKYYMHRVGLSWQDARAACQRFGGQLAEPKTFEEIARLTELHDHGLLWTGAQYLGNSFKWISNGTQLEPIKSGLLAGKQLHRAGHCAAIHSHLQVLHSHNCNTHLWPFCECLDDMKSLEKEKPIIDCSKSFDSRFC